MPTLDLATIRSSNWQAELGQVGGVVVDLADVEQSIRIVITTLPGEDPMHPAFGCLAMTRLDAPLSVARPLVVADVTEALRAWEPRAAVEGVELLPSSAPDARDGDVELVVSWRPAGAFEAELRRTVVRR